MHLDISSLAEIMADIRVVILAAALVLGGVFYFGWELRPIMSSYENVADVQTLARNNNRKIQKNETKIEVHETEINEVDREVRSLKQEQRAITEGLTVLNRNFKIFACTQQGVSDQTYARLNCGDFD